MAEERKAQPPPPGIVPMLITMKPMEAMGLKTGPGLKDTVMWKTFNTEEVKAEIVAKGFYSPFHGVRAELDVRRRSRRVLACAVLAPAALGSRGPVVCAAGNSHATRCYTCPRRAGHALVDARVACACVWCRGYLDRVCVRPEIPAGGDPHPSRPRGGLRRELDGVRHRGGVQCRV